MATKLEITLALLCSLVFMSQVIPGFKNEENKSYASQKLHVYYKAGGRKLVDNFGELALEVLDDETGANGGGGIALAPGPSGHDININIDCGQQCKRRCSLHSRQNVCLRACGTCCRRCGCVPPGTYGNREMCGKCYTDMKTHGNKAKCP